MRILERPVRTQSSAPCKGSPNVTSINADLLKEDTRPMSYAAVRLPFLIPSRWCTPFLTPRGISPAEGIAVGRVLCEENAPTTSYSTLQGFPFISIFFPCIEPYI